MFENKTSYCRTNIEKKRGLIELDRDRLYIGGLQSIVVALYNIALLLNKICT
jgi:hypothetical protein